MTTLLASFASSDWQTPAALGVVAAVVSAFVILRLRARRGSSGGCGQSGCSAVSPEVRRMKARLKKAAGSGRV